MPLIGDILDTIADVCGDPEQNMGRVVPYGIAPVDERMVGNNIDGGELIVIQGAPGSRKTTLAANFVANACISRRLPPNYLICIDTLESGMTIERYSLVLLSIVATKYLVYWTWVEQGQPDLLSLFSQGLPNNPIDQLITTIATEVNGQAIEECVIRPEFFRYYKASPMQHAAIEAAKKTMAGWPLAICGFSEHPDPVVRHKRTVDTTNLESSFTRWNSLYEKFGMRWLVIDHVQQYAIEGQDYDIQRSVTLKVGEWMRNTRGIVYLLSQIGVGSQKDARDNKGVKTHASGGQKLESESTLTWEVRYDETVPYYIKLRRPIKSRKGIHPDIAIPIEPNSGAFIGRATEYRKIGLNDQ